MSELLIQLLLENRCLKKWLITNRNVAHFAHYQESYCYHILIEKLYNKSEKDWEKIFIFYGRRSQRLSLSLILIFAACFFSLLDSFDSHVCESVTLVLCKLCAKLLDPKSSIDYWRRVLGEKLVVFGWESHKSSQSMKLFLVYSYLGMACLSILSDCSLKSI